MAILMAVSDASLDDLSSLAASLAFSLRASELLIISSIYAEVSFPGLSYLNYHSFICTPGIFYNR
jgi:hypothetical protein